MRTSLNQERNSHKEFNNIEGVIHYQMGLSLMNLLIDLKKNAMVLICGVHSLMICLSV